MARRGTLLVLRGCTMVVHGRPLTSVQGVCEMSALTARQSDSTASCGGEAPILNFLLSEDSQASLVKLSFFLKFPVGGRETACSW